jgi:integrase
MRRRAEVLTWLVAAAKADAAVREEEDRGPTFGELAQRWWTGVADGTIGKRKGRGGSGYSPTTLKGYERTLRKRLIPEFGGRHAAEITEVDWQLWVDRLSAEGLSRSRIANQVSVVSAIYGWASRPTRRLVPSNPVRAIELPPNDEKPRTRVAPLEEAERLLAALEPDDRVPYALALYAGLRRAEIYRLRWEDIEVDGYRLIVRKAKSAAGTNRRPPIAEPLREILRRAALRNPSGSDDPVSAVSVMSGKLAERATSAWNDAGLQRITLHECRHTYASFLMAAGYTLKELMEYMGHSDLQMVQRYTKLLPQPDELDPGERLNAYLRRRGRREN